MPSKQTQNYQLSQWVKTDKVLMDDFNADNKKIDDAIKAEVDTRSALAVQVAAKASQADLNAEISARQAAITAETNARQSLNTTLSVAVAKLGNCQVESFSYEFNPVVTTPTIRFSAPPEVFFAVGGNFLVGSRHLTYVERLHAPSSSAEGRMSATWSGSSCTLAQPLNGAHQFFAFSRKDL